VLLLLALPAGALAAEPGLAGQWHFDAFSGSGASATTPDSSGNGGTGQFANTPTFAPGRFDSAFAGPVGAEPMTVSGTSGNGSWALEPSAVSLTAWVKYNGNPGTLKYIAAKGDFRYVQHGADCAGSSYAFYTGISGRPGLTFYVNTAGGNRNSPNLADNSKVFDGQWHAITGTYDGTNANLYVDGALVPGAQTGSGSGAITYGGSLQEHSEFGVGAYPDAGTCPDNSKFPGAIDEVRVHNRALSSDEITKLHDPSATTPPDLTPAGPPPPPPPETLTVTTTGGAGTVTSSPAGISCPGDCTEEFPRGTVVELTGSPSNGLGFAGWGDDCEGQTGATCTLTMDASKSALGAFTSSSSLPGLNIELARPFKPGKALVFTATMNGAPIDTLFGFPVLQLQWNFANTSKSVFATRPYVPNFLGQPLFVGHLGPSVRVRPNVVGSGSVQLTAVLQGGAVLQTKRAFFSKSFVSSHKPTDANALDIADALNKANAPNVYATGDPDVLANRTHSCGQMTIQVSASTLDGCFRPVEELFDVPENERGVLLGVSAALGLNLFQKGIADRIPELIDGYVGKGRVIINGRWPVDSHDTGRIVSYPQGSALASSNASLRLVRRDVYGPNRPILSIKLDPKKTSFRPGAGLDLGINTIGGFKVVKGDNSTLLTADKGLLATGVELPGYINRNGVPVRAAVDLTIQPESASSDGMTIGPTNVNFGAVPINGFKIVFNENANKWFGQGRACFLNITCFDLQPPFGGITIDHGAMVARTARDFGSPGVPLVAPATLQHIDFGVGLDPTRLLGTAKVAVGPLVTIDGRAVLAFPSSRTPYFLRRDEVGNNFPANLYSQRNENPVIALGADATVHIPVIGDTTLGNGYLLYELGGYGAFGGRINVRLLKLIQFTSGVAVEMDGPKGLYNLHGDSSACLILIPKLCGGTVANISRGPNNAGGAGACIQAGPVSVGGGRQWANPVPFWWPIDGCRWSPFKLTVRGKVQAAAAGALTIKIKRGQPSQAIQLSGQGGAPLVRVSGPAGQVLDSTPGGFDVSADRKIRIMRIVDPESNVAVIGLQNARPGTYTISLLPGSVPITKISRASDPPPATVTGKLAGKGAKRVLHYDIRKRRAQKVQFYDITPNGAAKAIGSVVVGGGKGTRSFAPSPGRGLHKIVARFELNGMPAEEKTVLRFKPPSPTLGRPGALRVTRARNGALKVSWHRVPGATSYQLVVTKSVGGQKALTTRRSRVTIRGIARTVSGRVSVRGLAKLREGAIAQKPFRRLAAPAGARLRHCVVKKHKLTCRR
jgi:hypothetical protein